MDHNKLLEALEQAISPKNMRVRNTFVERVTSPTESADSDGDEYRSPSRTRMRPRASSDPCLEQTCGKAEAARLSDICAHDPDDSVSDADTNPDDTGRVALACYGHIRDDDIMSDSGMTQPDDNVMSYHYGSNEHVDDHKAPAAALAPQAVQMSQDEGRDDLAALSSTLRLAPSASVIDATSLETAAVRTQGKNRSVVSARGHVSEQYRGYSLQQLASPSATTQSLSVASGSHVSTASMQEVDASSSELERLKSENARLRLENENARLLLENKMLKERMQASEIARAKPLTSGGSVMSRMPYAPLRAGPLPVLLHPGAQLEQGAQAQELTARNVQRHTQDAASPQMIQRQSDRILAVPERQQLKADAHKRTTVMLRNLPLNYNRAMILTMLDDAGFAGRYDFVYLPIDFKSRACLGYAFINVVDPTVVASFWKKFKGFADWVLPSKKVCNVTWCGPSQGLESHIERYRNSPVMHSSVPDEYKPVVFKDGLQVPFPPPTQAPKPPRVRKSP